MSETSIDRRRALIEQMRSQSGDTARNRFVESRPRYNTYETETDEEEEFKGFSSWKIKFVIAIALFIGFMFLDATNAKFYKVSSKNVEASISESVKTEEVATFFQKQINGILKK